MKYIRALNDNCLIMSERKRYNELGDFFKKIFPYKVQKISVNAGFTCPNRDGSKGFGGCTYCNNQTFSPDYCHTEESVEDQIKKGITFFGKKYPDMRYLAYFQAYTNTYGELESLKQKYETAISQPGVVGIIIGTRPDCMPDSLLDYLEELSKRVFVMVEYGVESTSDQTLEYINRGHSYECAEDAVRRTAARGIYTGVHTKFGLTGESEEMIFSHAEKLSELRIVTIKLNQLQLIDNTRMARQFIEKPEKFHIFDIDEYIDLAIDFIERVREDIVIERFVSQSPKELLIAPDWGLKNFEFTAKINKRLVSRDTWQGRLYQA